MSGITSREFEISIIQTIAGLITGRD